MMEVEHWDLADLKGLLVGARNGLDRAAKDPSVGLDEFFEMTVAYMVLEAVVESTERVAMTV